jgi:hypothetical protein
MMRRLALYVFLVLIGFPEQTNAGRIDYFDGVCIEELAQGCALWRGDGFIADPHSLIDPPFIDFMFHGTSFYGDFRLYSSDVMSHILWKTDDGSPFTPLLLGLTMGSGEPPFDCPVPMRVLSSNGGSLYINPPGANDASTCVVSGHRQPWWDSGAALIAFSGPQWTDIDWLVVGMVHVDPFPRAAYAQMSLQVPEPSTLLLLGGGLAVAGWRTRRRVRQAGASVS